MPQRNKVSIAVQVILCFIPLVWLYGFYRIEKLTAGILMVIGVAVLSILLAWIPVFGYAIAWIVSVLVPIYYMIKWSQQWNEEILREDQYNEDEEADDTETRYKLD